MLKSKNIFASLYNFIRNASVVTSRTVLTYLNNRKLRRYKDKYKGKRCFIIGNGPSLNKTDLTLLKNEYTFGLNRIYLNFDKMGYETKFIVIVNELLISQIKNDIKKLKQTLFINKNIEVLDLLDTRKNIIKMIKGPLFSDDIEKGLWDGSTVTYVAIQLAYYMGFTEVYLVGVDHNFKSKGIPNSTQKMLHEDPNHFSPNYFKGFKWQLPDLNNSERAYKLADIFYRKNKRKIVDLTVNGKLKIFKKDLYTKVISIN